MKVFSYLSDIRAYGEKCRMLIVGSWLYIAISKERKRFIVDIVFNPKIKF